MPSISDLPGARTHRPTTGPVRPPPTAECAYRAAASSVALEQLLDLARPHAVEVGRRRDDIGQKPGPAHRSSLQRIYRDDLHHRRTGASDDERLALCPCLPGETDVSWFVHVDHAHGILRTKSKELSPLAFGRKSIGTPSQDVRIHASRAERPPAVSTSPSAPRRVHPRGRRSSASPCPCLSRAELVAAKRHRGRSPSRNG